MSEFDPKEYILELLRRTRADLFDNKPVAAYEHLKKAIEWYEAMLKKDKEAEQ